ncbi:MAG: uroporphyrinogen-III C-methyltransferase, partial [Spirochaetota bacterium]|nr:uroporphyrinogen-III C-methyltransferase [Spirochaetota bacterium]
GKKGSCHTLSQENITKLIIEKAKEGKTVARLKGGDPFIFGRGGEEAEELANESISFSIIPGVSSFYSAPAFAGIPLTHRDYANSIEVITGHRRDDKVDDEINLPQYNDQKTFVFLMGMKNLKYIAERLVSEKGFPEDTPVGIVSWGTTPRQKVVTGILKDIADRVSKTGIQAPAIIIIGRVVLLREKLKWFDKLPLLGMNIVVTRTRDQASDLVKKLYQLGARTIEFPTIEIRQKENIIQLNKAIDEIEVYDWIIFTSQNAVKIFFRILKDEGKDARYLGKTCVAAIGPATAKELNNFFIIPDLIPSKYVAEEILKEMREIGVTGKRILLPCASEARKTLLEGLVELGAEVNRVDIYDTILPDNIPEDLQTEVKSADLITFTSSSTAKNFFSIFSVTNAITACIGPITAETVTKLSHNPDIIASDYTIDGLVNAILTWKKNQE